ncbi:N-6 DNA methylase [Streptomyces globisporus]|uniref:N-6 DNA methylase n=1 Tax=Streptomyces globisporus TaxID=1908 RepID=UPI00364EFE23
MRLDRTAVTYATAHQPLLSDPPAAHLGLAAKPAKVLIIAGLEKAIVAMVLRWHDEGMPNTSMCPADLLPPSPLAPSGPADEFLQATLTQTYPKLPPTGHQRDLELARILSGLWNPRRGRSQQYNAFDPWRTAVLLGVYRGTVVKALEVEEHPQCGHRWHFDAQTPRRVRFHTTSVTPPQLRHLEGTDAPVALRRGDMMPTRTGPLTDLIRSSDAVAATTSGPHTVLGTTVRSDGDSVRVSLAAGTTLVIEAPPTNTEAHYTPRAVLDALTEIIGDAPLTGDVVDPAVGSGAFLVAAHRAMLAKLQHPETIDALTQRLKQVGR